jgi:hypothetical protein
VLFGLAVLGFGIGVGLEWTGLGWGLLPVAAVLIGFGFTLAVARTRGAGADPADTSNCAADPRDLQDPPPGSVPDVVQGVRVARQERVEVRGGLTGEPGDGVRHVGDVAVRDRHVRADPGLDLPVGGTVDRA